MSLHSFHLFFIVVSILLSGFLGFWGIQKDVLPMVFFAGISGVIMALYLIWFLKKSKKAAKLGVISIFLLSPLLLSPQTSQACAVCFGVTDYQTRQANNNAVLFLIGLTSLVLIAVSYFVIKTLRGIPKT